MPSMTREEYAKLPSAELVRRLRNAERRSVEARDDAAYLTDMFAIQELCAAMDARGENAAVAAIAREFRT